MTNKERNLILQETRDAPVYDHLKERKFLLPPIWNIAIILLYTMRRVNCKYCGKVVVEQVPWATGKSPVTNSLLLSWHIGQENCLGQIRLNPSRFPGTLSPMRLHELLSGALLTATLTM